MRVPFIVGGVVAVALAAALACGPAPPTSSPDVDQHICPVLFPAGSPVDTVNVALFDTVDPAHAPNWTNRSEQIVFGHLYETISIKAARCGHEPITQAVLSDSGRVAVFTLRNGARFWDGTPVTARDATTSLMQSEAIDSVFSLDNKRFEVRVAKNDFDWATIESPRLAITKWKGERWRTGTGRYRVGSEGKGTIVLAPMNPDRDPVVRFIDARNLDPRDLVDGSFQPLIDVMVLDDAITVEYARGQDLTPIELYPSKAYVLLSPPRAAAIAKGVQVPALPLSVVHAIVRDARTANVQALEENDPRWTRSRHCSTGPNMLTRSPINHRIAYNSADPVSRDIAERIVALAGGDTSSSEPAALHAALPGLVEKGKIPNAAGMDWAALAESAREGRDFAYVVQVPFYQPDPCYVTAELKGMAPWMADAAVERKAVPLCVVGSSLVAAKVDRGYGYDVRLDTYGGFIVVGRDPGEPR